MSTHLRLFIRPVTLAATLMACSAPMAIAQTGSTFVDAQSNIFGYGLSAPAPAGGGGGVNAITINLDSGINRVLTISASGGAWWNGGGGSNGPDGGSFSGSTNISALGPISGYAAPLSGHLVGLFLEAGDPSALPTPANFSYPDAASLGAASYTPGIRQVFFLGDGLTGTGSGNTQIFTIPDSATHLVFGIADGFGFSGGAGYYSDNTGGYTVNYTVIPTPSTVAMLGISGLLMARRKR